MEQKKTQFSFRFCIFYLTTIASGSYPSYGILVESISIFVCCCFYIILSNVFWFHYCNRFWMEMMPFWMKQRVSLLHLRRWEQLWPYWNVSNEVQYENFCEKFTVNLCFVNSVNIPSTWFSTSFSRSWLNGLGKCCNSGSVLHNFQEQILFTLLLIDIGRFALNNACTSLEPFLDHHN